MASRRWNAQQGAVHRQKRGEGGTDTQTTQGKGIGANPCDRGKMGVKQSGCPLGVVEGSGYPIAVCIAGANLNDHLLLADTLDAVVVERCEPSEKEPENLCLDKGYDNKPTRKVVEERGYTEHIRRIGEEKKDDDGEKTHPARRWVVERTFAWLSRWRGLLVRWEKKPRNYLANVKLACALLWFRKAVKAKSNILR